MIQANELRIGNLVNSKNDGIISITNISEKSVAVSEAHCYNHIPVEFISPIQLTEEWLLKFGFFIIEINGKFEATLPNFRYNIYWNKYTDGFLFCDGETVLINFNYVHELQNLVFVLGQRELTVA